MAQHVYRKACRAVKGIYLEDEKRGRQSFRPPDFTERLKGLIGRRVITQIEKENPELPRGQLGRWLHGETFPTYEHLLILERIFGRSWAWFVVGDEGLKAMGALSPRDPIIIKLDERNYAIAMYQETENEISVYEIRHKGLRSKTLAATHARNLKDEQKL